MNLPTLRIGPRYLSKRRHLFDWLFRIFGRNSYKRRLCSTRFFETNKEKPEATHDADRVQAFASPIRARRTLLMPESPQWINAGYL
jgi:hypothetical protein